VARLGPSMAATCTRGKPEGGGGYMGTTGKRCGTYRSSQCSRSLLNSMRWDANIETFPDRGSLNSVHHDTRVFFGCFLQEEGGESMQEMGGGVGCLLNRSRYSTSYFPSTSFPGKGSNSDSDPACGVLRGDGGFSERGMLGQMNSAAATKRARTTTMTSPQVGTVSLAGPRPSDRAKDGHMCRSSTRWTRLETASSIDDAPPMLDLQEITVSNEKRR
jgi:hypothetical protein